MIQLKQSVFLALAGMLLSTSTLWAATTTIGHWQLGDDDTGAVSGGNATVGTFGQPVVGNNLNLANLGSTNTLTYTDDTYGSSSSLATSFVGDGGYWTDTFSAAQDNFGMEVWAKFNNNTDPVGWVAINGVTRDEQVIEEGEIVSTIKEGGWGIVQVADKIYGHYPFVGNVGEADIVVGEWIHLALIRDNGVGTLYVNGVAAGSTSTATPTLPIAALTIGYQHKTGSGSGDREWGNMLIDDLRVFEFEVGQFNLATDLTLLGTTPDQPIPGDANGDKKVDGSDVTILAGNWQAGVPDGDPENVTWAMGDFNGDGKVDGSDVTILAGNWQAGVTTAAASVPEPSTFALLLGALFTFVSMRQIKK